MTWSPLSRQSRGYGAAWSRVRLRVLARDGHLCRRCALAGRVTVGTEVHHVLPKARGGTDDMANLEVLCHDCHLAADAEAQGKTATTKSGFDANGNPTSPEHPWNRR
jgi:5-methylcytosine-specific restriction protein A